MIRKYIKQETPGVGAILRPRGHNLNKLGRGSLGEATYQIPMAPGLLVLDNKFLASLYWLYWTNRYK